MSAGVPHPDSRRPGHVSDRLQTTTQARPRHDVRAPRPAPRGPGRHRAGRSGVASPIHRRAARRRRAAGGGIRIRAAARRARAARRRCQRRGTAGGPPPGLTMRGQYLAGVLLELTLHAVDVVRTWAYWLVWGVMLPAFP